MEIHRFEAWEAHGEVEGFQKLKGGVDAFCGRRYVILRPGRMQDVEERLEKPACTSRGHLADGDTSFRSLEDPWRGRLQKLESIVHAFGGRRYIVLGPGRVQGTVEGSEKLEEHEGVLLEGFWKLEVVCVRFADDHTSF